MRKLIIITISTLAIIALIILGSTLVSQQQREEEISAERSRIRALSSVITLIGGDFELSYTEDGFPLIEYTFETVKAVINFGGLNAEFGMTQDEVIETLVRGSEHPQREEIIVWLGGRHFGSPQTDYAQALQDTLRDNFDIISAQFPDLRIGHNLELSPNTNITLLPLPVLRELIRLEEEQRLYKQLTP